jgi:hypothetical protein
MERACNQTSTTDTDGKRRRTVPVILQSRRTPEGQTLALVESPMGCVSGLLLYLIAAAVVDEPLPLKRQPGVACTSVPPLPKLWRTRLLNKEKVHPKRAYQFFEIEINQLILPKVLCCIGSCMFALRVHNLWPDNDRHACLLLRCPSMQISAADPIRQDDSC